MIISSNNFTVLSPTPANRDAGAARRASSQTLAGDQQRAFQSPAGSGFSENTSASLNDADSSRVARIERIGLQNVPVNRDISFNARQGLLAYQSTESFEASADSQVLPRIDFRV